MPITTPFPTNVGGPTTQTEDKYYCRSCLHFGFANEIGEVLTCELCDSTEVIDEYEHRREVEREREEADARWDRIAEYRARRRPYVPLTRSMSGYGHFDDRVQAMGSPVAENAMFSRQAA